MSDAAHSYEPTDPAAPALRGPSDDEVDALADLFLGPSPHADRGSHPTLRLETAPIDEDDDDTEPRASDSALIEGLVLGHLPVLGGAWVRQYAATRARELGGPVGFVRLGPGAAAVELVGNDAFAVTPEGDGLDEAIRAAAPFVRAWLIRVDELSEPELARLDGLDQLTLLSGADDPAVIASYRALKQFAGHDEASDGRSFRVVWMGCDAERAEAAARRLHRAADAFLEHDFDAEAFVPRIATVPVASVFRGEAELDTEDLLSLIRVVSDGVTPEASEPVRYAPPREPAAPQPTIEPIRPPVREAAPEPKVEAATPARAAHASRETAGSGAAMLGGLKIVPVTPPNCPHVEVAFDDAGAVHLVSRATGRGVPMPGLIAELTAARAWVLVQRDLLRLAAPEIGPLDEAHAPTLHLLTESPREARPLLDSPVRVHALTPVVVEGRTHWGCAALN